MNGLATGTRTTLSHSRLDLSSSPASHLYLCPSAGHLSTARLPPSAPRPRWGQPHHSRLPACPSAAAAVAGRVAARAAVAALATAEPSAAGSSGVDEQLSLYLRDGQYQAGATVFRQLLKQGVLPSLSTCNDTMSGLCRNVTWPQLRLLHALLGGLGVVLDRPVELKLLSTAIEEGHLTHAMAMFKSMVDADGVVDQRLYVTAISRLLHLRRRGVSNAERAYVLWLQLRDSGTVLDACSYRAGIHACAMHGFVQEASGLIPRMLAQGLRPGSGAFNILMKYYVRCGDIGTVKKLFRSMVECGSRPTSYSYNTLLKGFVVRGELDMAHAVMDKMRREGVPPDVRTYSTLMQGLARAQLWQRADALMRQMRADGVAPNHYTYAALVDGHLRQNNVPAAEAVVAAMRSDGMPPNDVVYNMLVKGYARRGAGGLSEALRLVDEMRADGLVPGTATYSTVLQAAVELQDEGAANAVLEVFQDAGCPRDAVVSTTMMKLYTVLGRYDDAVAVFSRLEAFEAEGGDSAVDLIALSALVDVFASAGRMADAEGALQRAADFAAQRGQRPPMGAFGALIKGYCRGGAVRPALLAFRRFLSAGGRPHSRMANAVVRVCLEGGEFKAAAQAIRAMELLGVPVNRQRYKAWFEKYRNASRQSGSSSGTFGGGSSGGGGLQSMQLPPAAAATGVAAAAPLSQRADGAVGGVAVGQPPPGDVSALERAKWWLGLPNGYYNSDWRS